MKDINHLEAMKGIPKVILTIFQDERTIHLREYADGSLGIIRDTLLMGIWEPNEESECFDMLLRLSGMSRDAAPLIVLNLRRNSQPLTAKSPSLN